jgi:CubicO group peptidase (beta-lactamase class C family)
MVKFHLALRSFKLLSKEQTELVATGKVDGPGGSRYGYGFGDNTSEGKHIVGHNGGAPGIAANFEMYPELGYTVVLLMNTDPPATRPIIKGIRQRIPAK